MSGDNILSAVVAPCTGAWIEKVEVVGGRLHTFLCERKNILFLLRVLSMYLTSYDFHLPVFRAFFALLVEVGGGRRLIVRLPTPNCKVPAVANHTGSADKRSD